MTLQHDVVIDLTRPQRVVIPVTQEDSTRRIALRLLNNGAPYNVSNDLASGETLLKFVEYRRADGSSGIYDTTSDGRTAVVAVSPASDGKWTVNLDGACFTVPGWAQINVRFMTESGKLLHSFPITVDVHDTACPDESGGDPTQIESIADMKAAISELYNASMSEEAKNALLNLLAHVAYVDEHGQDYLDDLEAELFRTADLVSISAVFEQGSAVIYDTDDLDTLRQYLTVTATYEDLSEREITGYTLSGTLTVGTSTITVSYGGKTATFDVTVSTILYSVPDFAAQTINAGGTATVSKVNGRYNFSARSSGVIYIYPNGTINANKSNTEWFSTIQGKSVRLKVSQINWSNPYTSDVTLNVKFGRADVTGNVISANLSMPFGQSGINAEAEFNSAEYARADKISCLGFQFLRSTGSGQYSVDVTASFNIELFIDGVRYL